MKGLLVNFEGQDGSGKSTLLRLVAERLETEGVLVTVIPEFSSNVVGEFLKGILKKNKFICFNKMGPSSLTETMYVLADLYSQDEIEITPAIKQGKVVLKERHIDSVLACQIPKIIEDYPSFDRKQLFYWFNQMSTYLTDPDLTFFLQVKNEILETRIKERGESVCKNDFIIFGKRQIIYDCLAIEKKKRWISLHNDGDPSGTVQTIITNIHQYRELTRKEMCYEA
ncbi:MAG: hypothetical protein WCK10_01715 [Candidatus Staskawiczbacteria bacterium]